MKKTIIVMPVANEESTMGQILDEILDSLIAADQAAKLSSLNEEDA